MCTKPEPQGIWEVLANQSAGSNDVDIDLAADYLQSTMYSVLLM
jgi:hypothetical protein